MKKMRVRKRSSARKVARDDTVALGHRNWALGFGLLLVLAGVAQARWLPGSGYNPFSLPPPVKPPSMRPSRPEAARLYASVELPDSAQRRFDHKAEAELVGAERWLGHVLEGHRPFAPVIGHPDWRRD